MFNGTIQNNFKLSCDDWYSERRLVTDTKYPVDIGSGQSVRSPIYLIAVHQTEARLNAPAKGLNISRFDNTNVRKKFWKKMVRDILEIMFLQTIV